MNIYTFANDRLSFRGTQEVYTLSDLSTLAPRFEDTDLGIYVVPREHAMRLDLISNHLYGSTDYVEELMKLNHILNPFSVKEGDYINYVSLDKMYSFYVKKEDVELNKRNLNLVDSAKNTEREKLPPTSKPRDVKQLTIDKKRQKIKIINNFQR
jgi:hypothetical protein